MVLLDPMQNNSLFFDAFSLLWTCKFQIKIKIHIQYSLYILKRRAWTPVL